MTSTAIMAAAVIAARTVDRDLRANVPDDIVNCIYGFSAGAAALALTPIPGWTWLWLQQTCGLCMSASTNTSAFPSRIT